METVQRPFFKGSKHVIVDLILTIDEHHLLVRLKRVLKRQTPTRPVAKKSIKGVTEGSGKAKSLFELEDVFDVDCSTPMQRKKLKLMSAHVLGVTIILRSILESKVDQMVNACSSRLERIDKRLCLLEGSCSSIGAQLRTIHKSIVGSSAPISQVA